MSTTTINFTFTVGGVPTDATSVVLRDAANTFGVRRTDTGGAVVAAGTAMTRVSAGVYAHAFTDPAASLTYRYWVEAVHGGATHRLEGSVAGGASAGTRAYLTVAAADGLAATLPALAAWSAADAPTKAKALERASVDVDRAKPYQGRKYDADQLNEFPRAPYDGASAAGSAGAVRAGAAPAVWDWDRQASEAVVPEDVLIAVVFQADAELAGTREARLAAQHDGVVYDLTGSLAESYKQTEGPGVATGLCRPAWVLMRKYRLKSGQVL
jgi:hypothetical protein